MQICITAFDFVQLYSASFLTCHSLAITVEFIQCVHDMSGWVNGCLRHVTTTATIQQLYFPLKLTVRVQYLNGKRLNDATFALHFALGYPVHQSQLK